MTSGLKIVFAGSPEFSVPVLEALMLSRHQVLAVFTQPDRGAGRGRKLQTSAIKKTALHHALPVFQPPGFSDPEVMNSLEQMQADLLIVVAYGIILPQWVLDTPVHGCWNIHASLLPRWRGAAPIQRAIIAGDRTTGVSIMQMDANLDTGSVITTREIEIGEFETGGSLHDRLSLLGANTLLACLEQLADGQPLPAQAQNSGQACYAEKLSKAEAEIDWQEPAHLIARKVRAFNPWPVAWTTLDGTRLRIWSAAAMESGGGHPGVVIARQADGVVVGCSEGCLRITELQTPGGKRISAVDYLNARQ